MTELWKLLKDYVREDEVQNNTMYSDSGWQRVKRLEKDIRVWAREEYAPEQAEQQAPQPSRKETEAERTYRTALENIQGICNMELGDWAGVTAVYLPTHLDDYARLHDIATEALNGAQS